LYRRHAAFIFAQCERRYGNAAEEITAEAFRRVYKSAARFDPSKLRLP
jgi:DNA-directed RNA polymerase specialized sigma24 family protein